MQAHTTATIPSLEHHLCYHFQQTTVIQLASSFHAFVAKQSKQITLCFFCSSVGYPGRSKVGALGLRPI
jgi:hypothetical protein